MLKALFSVLSNRVIEALAQRSKKPSSHTTMSKLCLAVNRFRIFCEAESCAVFTDPQPILPLARVPHRFFINTVYPLHPTCPALFQVSFGVTFTSHVLEAVAFPLHSKSSGSTTQKSLHILGDSSFCGVTPKTW